MSDSWPPWVTAAVGALPGIGAAFVAGWKLYSDWGKDRQADRVSRETREERDREALSQQRDAINTRLEAENKRLEEDLNQARKSADKAWRLARRHYDSLRDMRHSCVNAQTVATLLAKQAGLPLPVWQSIEVPPFDGDAS